MQKYIVQQIEGSYMSITCTSSSRYQSFHQPFRTLKGLQNSVLNGELTRFILNKIIVLVKESDVLIREMSC